MITPATRDTLDVSELPAAVLDHRSPVWWGNTLLLVIETTMFGILVACYFYLQQNFLQWPPVQSNTTPAIFLPLPKLLPSIVNLVIMAASCVTMRWADRSALKDYQRGVNLGLAATIALGLAAIGVRWWEFHALQFRWDENAYGSIVWMILGMHVMHLIVGTCENSLMLMWLSCHGLDDKHARDVHITGIYWYWIGIIWIPLWAIIFLGPHLFS